MEDENRVACGSPDAFVQRACETLVHRVLHDDEPRIFADEGPSDFGRTIAAPVFDDEDFLEGRILQPQRRKAALQSTSSIEHGDDGGCGAKGFPLQGHRSRSPTLARIQLDSKAKDLAEEPERVARQFHRGSVRRALDPIDRDFGDAQAAHCPRTRISVSQNQWPDRTCGRSRSTASRLKALNPHWWSETWESSRVRTIRL